MHILSKRITWSSEGTTAKHLESPLLKDDCCSERILLRPKYTPLRSPGQVGRNGQDRAWQNTQDETEQKCLCTALEKVNVFSTSHPKKLRSSHKAETRKVLTSSISIIFSYSTNTVVGASTTAPKCNSKFQVHTFDKSLGKLLFSTLQCIVCKTWQNCTALCLFSWLLFCRLFCVAVSHSF